MTQSNDPRGMANDEKPPASPTLWRRIQAWDGQLSIAKSLTAVTLITGFLGGYFQYLSAYEEKVSIQAKADMAEATSTFVEISNAFAEAQTLQEIIFFNFRDWLTKSDPSEKAMVTKAANDAFPAYVTSRTSLRQKSRILARKAEINIDWASDLGRDPAAKRDLSADPLTETLLGEYNFDCDINLPQLKSAKTEPPPGSCAAREANKQYLDGTVLSLCATEKGKIVPGKPPIAVNWQSAKHHVLTMRYCFGIAHEQIETARLWASGKDPSESSKADFRSKLTDRISSLNNQVIRLNAFMTVAMSQLERIRVKYRPSSFYCHLPIVRDAIGLVSDRCTPIRTGSGGTA